jgi:hypothetical protein
MAKRKNSVVAVADVAVTETETPNVAGTDGLDSLMQEYIADAGNAGFAGAQKSQSNEYIVSQKFSMTNEVVLGLRNEIYQYLTKHRIRNWSPQMIEGAIAELKQKWFADRQESLVTPAWEQMQADQKRWS